MSQLQYVICKLYLGAVVARVLDMQTWVWVRLSCIRVIGGVRKCMWPKLLLCTRKASPTLHVSQPRL